MAAVVADSRAPCLAFLVHLVVVFGVAALSVVVVDQRPAVPALDYYPRPMTGIARYLIQPLATWDATWYVLIAEHGYWIGSDEGAATAAFWPLYPLLLRIGHVLTGWSVPVVGVLLSNTAFAGGLVLLHRLVRLDYGEAVARRTVWLLALFPTSFFFSAVYTESLFLLLTVGAVFFGRVERWGLASFFGFLAALTRNTGVLLIIPLGILLLRQHGWSVRRLASGLQLGVIGLAPLLFLGYIGMIWRDPLLPFDAQRLPWWDRYQAMPWVTLAEAFRQAQVDWLGRLLAHPSVEAFTAVENRTAFADSKLFDLSITLAFILLAAYSLFRVRLAYSLYAVLTLLIPLTSPSHFSPLMGMPRYVLVLFPCFIVLALLLRRRWLLGGVLALSIVLLAGAQIQFSNWFFVA